jgi:hypothetical protein|tara:strand:+ start:1196 stop:1645 length:450 start_codon:yes stop_codon:yes gene_type:complete
MKEYLLHSLVDITKTDQLHNTDGNDISRDQHRNYQTLIQTLGLRTQPTIINEPRVSVVENLRGIHHGFGESYKGSHSVWTVKFSVEYTDVFRDEDGNDIGYLEEDFNQVPVISMLTETARFILPCFFSYGPLKNIDFNKIQQVYSIRGH